MVERQRLLFADNASVSGVLIDTEIQDAVDRGWLISKETFHSSSLEASSYDVRVGAKGVVGGEAVEIDLRSRSMELGPGEYGGIISNEKFLLPENVCARIGSKRALSRIRPRGTSPLSVHMIRVCRRLVLPQLIDSLPFVCRESRRCHLRIPLERP